MSGRRRRATPLGVDKPYDDPRLIEILELRNEERIVDKLYDLLLNSPRLRGLVRLEVQSKLTSDNRLTCVLGAIAGANIANDELYAFTIDIS